MISVVNFARIASTWVGFHLGTLHGYFFHQDFWPNLNFLLEYQIKRVLISPKYSAGSAVSGMVNLAGSEKCYGNKSCIKLRIGVLFGTRRAWK